LLFDPKQSMLLRGDAVRIETIFWLGEGEVLVSVH